MRQGHEVTVLAPTEAISRGLEIRVEDGLRVVRVRTGRIKGANRVSRALGEVRLSGKLWKEAGHFLADNPCDLVIFYSPTIFFSRLVRELKARWNCPAYLILRDIFPRWAVDMGILKRGPVLAYFRGKERQQYEAANIIAVQTRADLEYFAREFPGNRYRVEVLYNWTALDEPNLPVTTYRAQLGLEGKVVFFYGGNIGVAQDMDNILQLASNVSHEERIHFLLVGEGTAVQQMKDGIARRRLTNIQILPAVGQREYLAMVSEFDVGLVSLDRRLKTHNVPGKILSYLYWGKPVLASINPGNDLFELLREGGAGFCLENGDDAELAAAALRLADDCGLRDGMGKNSRQLLERTFSVRAAVEQIMKRCPYPVYAAEGADAAAVVGSLFPANRLQPHQ